ncbi:hypothetical protein QQS21_010690 [Conoideocrella luteorostrata]|uniref:Uncharacterized protein n=1 Tax=Conoideocrella luteorostrata TaxID=1105319 RepID=A0AAJ0CJ01_9HYPO|nr:hypothetical protein QQS21_010690 [Conoideocrella luteorostrata]
MASPQRREEAQGCEVDDQVSPNESNLINAAGQSQLLDLVASFEESWTEPSIQGGFNRCGAAEIHGSLAILVHHGCRHLTSRTTLSGRARTDNVAQTTARGQMHPAHSCHGYMEGQHPGASHGYTDDIQLGSDLERPPAQINMDRAVLIEPGDQGAALRPRYICLIRDYDSEILSSFSSLTPGSSSGLQKMMILTTISIQVLRPARPTDSSLKRGRQTLLRRPIDAAKRAGKQAFWIVFECVWDKDGVARSTSKSDDVYRIWDIVGSAHSRIIAIGPPASDKLDAIMSIQGNTSNSGSGHTNQWLRQCSRERNSPESMRALGTS